MRFSSLSCESTLRILRLYLKIAIFHPELQEHAPRGQDVKLTRRVSLIIFHRPESTTRNANAADSRDSVENNYKSVSQKSLTDISNTCHGANVKNLWDLLPITRVRETDRALIDSLSSAKDSQFRNVHRHLRPPCALGLLLGLQSASAQTRLTTAWSLSARLPCRRRSFLRQARCAASSS